MGAHTPVGVQLPCHENCSHIYIHHLQCLILININMYQILKRYLHLKDLMYIMIYVNMLCNHDNKLLTYLLTYLLNMERT